MACCRCRPGLRRSPRSSRCFLLTVLAAPVPIFLAFAAFTGSRPLVHSQWGQISVEDDGLRSGIPDDIWQFAQDDVQVRSCERTPHTSSLSSLLCALEAQADNERKPRQSPVVLVRDTSRVRYFAKRDLQAWQVAYERLGMQVVEPALSEPTRLRDFVVLICLGLAFMEELCLRANEQVKLATWQRVNQIYGIRWILWRKDGFCRTLTQAIHDLPATSEKRFFFPCWILPDEIKLLREQAAANYDSSQAWIVKPLGRGEGYGIFITQTIADIEKRQLAEGVIVQPFLERPLLIEGRKWDLRTYVLVTSITPLRAYFYSEGLVRFTALPYNATRCRQGTGNEHRCLTNTSINKRFAHISNLTWTYKRLRLHLEKIGVSGRAMFRSVRDAIARVLLASELEFRALFANVKTGYECPSCFQLLGVDVILDENLHPYVIEINGLPSMQLSHEAGVPYDSSADYTKTKLSLTHDMLEILFRPPPAASQLAHDLRGLQMHHQDNKLCPNPSLTPPESTSCLDNVDMQHVLQAQREIAARGGFVRIYPTSDGEKYDELVYHMHKKIVKHLGPQTRTNWRTHWTNTMLEKINRVRNRGE